MEWNGEGGNDTLGLCILVFAFGKNVAASDRMINSIPFRACHCSYEWTKNECMYAGEFDLFDSTALSIPKE